MFKPNFGICKCHNLPNLIVVKAGWCKIGNEERKKPAKDDRAKRPPKLNAEKLLNKQLPSIPKLVEQLDDVFSIYIRTIYADEYGIVKCVTCSNRAHWRQMDNGHYWSRRFYAVRWELTNCGPQCTGCNMYSEGNKPAYTQYIIIKHGQAALDRLNLKYKNTFKLERFNLDHLIKYFTQQNINIARKFI